MTAFTPAPTHLIEQLGLIPVPAGTLLLGLEQKVAERFINGYGPDWNDFFLRETPQHEVKIDAFELSRYPATNGFYAQFIADDGYRNPQFWTPDGWAWVQRTRRQHPTYWYEPKFAGEDWPVVGVSWFEAMAVARWVSIRTGRNVRLPDEAEWEWAGRGTNTKWLYPWGPTWDPVRLNSGYKDDKHTSKGGPTPVGLFSSAGDGPFGHGELLGQVWEWTNSLFRPYPYNPTDGREDRYAPERRVMRGGNWSDGKYTNRLTARYYYPPYYADTTDGFRLAADGSAPPIAGRPDFDLVIYGRSTFCPDLVKVKNWLHAWNVPYRQVQVDLDEGSAARLDQWIGSRTVPTIIVAHQGEVDPIAPPAEVDLRQLRNMDRGTMLHEPDEETLRVFLARYKFLV